MSEGSILMRKDSLILPDFAPIPAIASLQRQTLQTIMLEDFVPIKPSGKTTGKTNVITPTKSKITITDETIDQKYKVKTQNDEINAEK